MSQDENTWRLSFDLTMSHGLKGGHPDLDGLTADGRLIRVAEHQHQVELDVFRLEWAVSRTFGEHWDAALRVPYFIKDQVADIAFPADGDAHDRDAAQRNNDIHHRSETYRGFSDLELTAGWRTKGIFGIEDAALRVGFGFTIPTGSTEPDPWKAGDDGREHLHILFGNGTVDPLLDVYLGIPLSEHWAFSTFAKARLPFYENKHGYRGAPELIAVPRVTWLPHKAWALSAGVALSYQGYSEWPSGRDRNSGQFTLNAALSAGVKVTDRMTASLSALLPVYDRAFQGEDQMEAAPAFSLSMAVSF